MVRPSLSNLLLLASLGGCAQSQLPAHSPTGDGPATLGPVASCLAAAQSRLGGAPPLNIQGPAFDAGTLKWKRRNFSGGFQEPSPAPEARQAFARISPVPTIRRIIGHGEARGANRSSRLWLERLHGHLDLDDAPWTFADGRGRTASFAVSLDALDGGLYQWKVRPLSKDASPRRPTTLDRLESSVFTVQVPSGPVRWLLEWDPPAGLVWFEADAVEFGTADGPFCLPCATNSLFPTEMPAAEPPSPLF